jgi:nicotinate-nucleotide adenylyltransferase
MKKAIGFYGGTFNPIHFGHLNLALEMKEKKHLDEVWFCPAYINPHRLDEPPLTAYHRQAMLELAIAPIPFFRLIDYELKRQEPSYTVDTLRFLSNSSSEITFFLILGEDALPGFFSWHQPKEILKIAKPLVGTRKKELNHILQEADLELIKSFEEGTVPTREMDISSTEIRSRLRNDLYCGHLMPKEVLDYIQAHRLYSL